MNFAVKDAQTAGAKTRGGAELICAAFTDFLTQTFTPLSSVVEHAVPYVRNFNFVTYL